jgi:hypothetical protein
MHSLKTVSRELAKCELNLINSTGGQMGKDDTESADDFVFFGGNGDADQAFSYTRLSYQHFKRVQFACSRMSYIIVRGR